MKASQFLQVMKNQALQNISQDYNSDSVWVFYINAWLDYIYRFLNARHVRPYSVVDETIGDWTATNEFTSTYSIQWIIIDKFFEGSENVSADVYWYNSRGMTNFETRATTINDSNTGVIADPDANWEWTQLYRKNFIANTDQNTYAFVSWIDGIQTVKTGKNFSYLRLRYKRWPQRIDVWDLTVDVDLPVDLLWSLLDFCMWRIYPVHLENGFDLANNYFQHGVEDLTNYVNSLWSNIENNKFSA